MRSGASLRRTLALLARICKHASVLSAALCAAVLWGACEDENVCELTPVGGWLTAAPEDENAGGAGEVWSLDGTTLKLYAYSQSGPQKATCTLTVSAGAHVYPGSSITWIIAESSLHYVDFCENPVLAAAGKFAAYEPAQGAILGGPPLVDRPPSNAVLIAYAQAETSGRYGNPSKQLYIFHKGRNPETPVTICEARDERLTQTAGQWSGRDCGHTPERPAQAPTVMKTTPDGRAVWMAVGDLLCRMEASEIRRQPTAAEPEPVCVGRRFNRAAITDISLGPTRSPIWIATEKGAFAWPDTTRRDIEHYNIGKIISIQSDSGNPNIAWALTERRELYRLELGTGSGAMQHRSIQMTLEQSYTKIRAVHGMLVLIGPHGVDECLTCSRPDPRGPVATQALARGAFKEVYEAPHRSLWLSGSESALCRLEHSGASTLVGCLIARLELGTTALGVIVIVILIGVTAAVAKPLRRTVSKIVNVPRSDKTPAGENAAEGIHVTHIEEISPSLERGPSGRTHIIRILHLSDMHASGQRGERRAFRRTQVLGDAWLRNLGEIAEDGRAFDLVVFTGDIADWGLPDEYAAATPFLDSTLTRLAVPHERLFVVPGNHDVNRKVEVTAWNKLREGIFHQPQPTSQWLADNGEPPFRFDPEWRDAILRRQHAFWAWLERDLGRGELLPTHSPHRRLGYAVSVPGLPVPVHIIGLDSAWLAGDDADADKLWLTEDQLGLLCTDSGNPWPGFRLALVHHPLSALADHDTASHYLADNVDLLLRGHQHDPIARAAGDPDRTLRELAAGCLFEGARGNRHPNGCHLIDITLDHNGRPLAYDIRFRTWSPRGHWYDDGAIYREAAGGRLSWKLSAQQHDSRPRRRTPGRTSE